MTRLVGVAAVCAAAILWYADACPAAELRGAWVTSWAPGFFTKEEVDSTIAAARKAGLNALFIEVRKCADAYYNSSLEPRGAEIAPHFDPLAYTIERAHAEGIQVHAWLVIYRAWAGKSSPTNPDHIVLKHPDWLNVDFAGNNRGPEGIYLDPGVPEVRDHILAVVEDIVKHYGVDGIHYDYIRYPGRDWGYSERALSIYRQETGTEGKPEPTDPRWQQWRRDQVTTLVQAVHDRVKAIAPDVAISASTIPWGDCPEDFTEASPYTKVYQDWRSWLARGLIDANCPMVYRTERTEWDARSYRGWLDGCRKWNGGKPTWVGTDANENPVADVVKQVGAIRQAGLEGFVLFSFNQSAKRLANAEALGAALGPAPTVPTSLRKIAEEGSDVGI